MVGVGLAVDTCCDCVTVVRPIFRTPKYRIRADFTFITGFLGIFIGSIHPFFSAHRLFIFLLLFLAQNRVFFLGNPFFSGFKWSSKVGIVCVDGVGVDASSEGSTSKRRLCCAACLRGWPAVQQVNTVA